MADDEPNSKQLINYFRASLDAEEGLIRERLARDNLGLYLRTAVAEFDLYFYNLARTKTPTDEQNELFYLLTLGVGRLVQLALTSRPSFDVPTITLKHNPKLTHDTLELVSRLGFIEHGRRIADSAVLGLCTLTRTDDRFEFLLPEHIIDHDFHEQSVTDHYRLERVRQFRERLPDHEAVRAEELIQELLTDNVRSWNVDFISYDAHPILDQYFMTLGFHALTQSEGHDTYNWSVEFGGVTFQKYYIATAFLISLALKHERFCEALIKKNPEISLRNILTITCDREGLVENIKEVLNQVGPSLEDYKYTSLDEARRICGVLSITRQTTPLLARPNSPLPFAIEFSDVGFISSIAGAQRSPAQFLLSSLRYHFPREYDKNQRRREASMQKALSKELDASFKGLEYRTNITIRGSGRTLTDIDLVVVDRTFGTLLLVQLKFQDLHGSDVRVAGTRSKRLRDEAERWLQVTKGWLAKKDDGRLHSSLGLPRSQKIRHIYRLVIARHYAHSIGALSLDDDTAFGTWLQFCNAIAHMKKYQGSFMTISGLVAVLRKHVVAAPTQHHRSDGIVEYNLASLKFVTRQAVKLEH